MPILINNNRKTMDFFICRAEIVGLDSYVMCWNFLRTCKYSRQKELRRKKARNKFPPSSQVKTDPDMRTHGASTLKVFGPSGYRTQ